MGVIRPAFTDSENPNVQNAGVVMIKTEPSPLDILCRVQDDFCLLAGPTAGTKSLSRPFKPLMRKQKQKQDGHLKSV